MDTIEFYSPRDEYGFLSNFSPHGIDVEGQYWRTMEHFFQGMKTLEASQREAIRAATTPRQAKNLGRECDLREDWEKLAPVPESLHEGFSDDQGLLVATTKDHYMFYGLTDKFHQHLDLQEQLLATGDAVLVEASPGDAYWGNAFKSGAHGQNKLGRMLMMVRKRARERLAEEG